MNTASKAAILEAWSLMPAGTKYPPASEEDLNDFESIHGLIPPDYRWFLQSCGGGVIGSEWVDSIDELYATQTKFHEQCQHPNGWKTKEMFIIGWDGGGNPMGIMPDGSVVVEDHDFGGIHLLATTVEEFLLKGLDVAAK